jgi:hypothetical protein
MAHYAFLDENNTVTDVITGRDENDLVDGVSSWEEYYGNFRNQRCLRTSYNAITNGFRKNYAGIGYTYDESKDAFIPPKPYESWVLDETTCRWNAPVAAPQDENDYIWDESSTSWIIA